MDGKRLWNHKILNTTLEDSVVDDLDELADKALEEKRAGLYWFVKNVTCVTKSSKHSALDKTETIMGFTIYEWAQIGKLIEYQVDAARRAEAILKIDIDAAVDKEAVAAAKAAPKADALPAINDTSARMAHDLLPLSPSTPKFRIVRTRSRSKRLGRKMLVKKWVVFTEFSYPAKDLNVEKTDVEGRAPDS